MLKSNVRGSLFYCGHSFSLGVILIRGVGGSHDIMTGGSLFSGGHLYFITPTQNDTFISTVTQHYTVIILNIGTDMSEQTVQTQIRLLLMEQSDQGLLCLLFCLHLLNTILHCKIQKFQLYDNYGNYFRCPNF